MDGEVALVILGNGRPDPAPLLHRTVNNMFSACNSGHVKSWIDKVRYYGSIEIEIELLAFAGAANVDIIDTRTLHSKNHCYHNVHL